LPLTVVVGGQYGSEGKGKLVSYLACRDDDDVAVVRCGGSNAGHTAEGVGRRVVLRQLPSGAVNPRCRLLLAAGMQIDLGVLLDEIHMLRVGSDRMRIDRNATIIEPGDKETERQTGLLARVGSTLTGTGAAGARKVLRDASVRRAGDVPELQPYVTDVARELDLLLADDFRVIVEGTQGAGLSLHHGPYPFVTSRDTTAAGVLSEAGLPPSRVDDVIVVFRTYPIRVAGNSGPLAGELDWATVRERAGYPGALAEYTTVTGRLRRVGAFDWDLAERAVRLNGPTALAVHGLDYLCYEDLGATRWDELSAVSQRFLAELEDRLQIPVHYLYTGPEGSDLIDLTSHGTSGPRSLHGLQRTL
jgi:adenylosuccinate synthase